MRIKNATGRPLMAAIRGVVGFDDREDLMAPGEESDDFIGCDDGDSNGVGATVIRIEECS